MLATNRFFYKNQRKVTDKCLYCNEESESITHLFFSCEQVQDFWRELKTRLLNNANISLQFDF